MEKNSEVAQPLEDAANSGVRARIPVIEVNFSVVARLMEYESSFWVGARLMEWGEVNFWIAAQLTKEEEVVNFWMAARPPE